MSDKEALSTIKVPQGHSLLVRRNFGKDGEDVYQAVSNLKKASYLSNGWETIEAPAPVPADAKPKRTRKAKTDA